MPLCLFICFHKSSDSEAAESQWLHLIDYLLCAYSNVSSNAMHKRMHTHIGCICMAFLPCVFSNATSNGVFWKLHKHRDGICLAFLHCVFSNASSNLLPERMHVHTCYICMIFLRCVFSNVSSKRLREEMHSYTGCIFSTVCFHMRLHSACIKGCIVTLVTFV